jgi:DNA mismatch repair protein MutS
MHSPNLNNSQTDPITTTPLMEQYLKIKAKHSDAILLYRMGDFYETFYEDEKIVSKILGIALTKRAHGKTGNVPLAGFPYHALDNYLHTLVKAGHRVAICEQTEDPKFAKGIVKRDVIEIVTPGSTLSEKLLENKKNNFLAAIFLLNNNAGIALADVSTGEFYISEFDEKQIEEQLIAFQPKEILAPESLHEEIKKTIETRLTAVLTKRDDWIFSYDYAKEMLINHFKTHSLKGFGIENMQCGIIAAGAILNYFQENYTSELTHINRIKYLNGTDFMILDESTRNNLEIRNPIRENLGGNTLLAVIDDTSTSMGGRMMQKWLNHPLRFASQINERLDWVEALFNNREILTKLRKKIAECSDIERLIGKIVTGRANGRDLVNLKKSLCIIPEIKKIIDDSKIKILIKRFSVLSALKEVTKLIEKAIVNDPPVTITDGGVILKGYNKDLDELREIAYHGKKWIADLQDKERKRTNISNLKINYNKVFGYYIEVTKTHLSKVPDDYIRKQTLVNAERFITPDLKEKEDKILNAEEKLKSLEYEIFQQVRQKIAEYTNQIQTNSENIAILDCLCSFAQVAMINKYVRPQVNDKLVLKIKNGRHPVVEKFIPAGEEFVANDLYLDPDKEQIWMITGPNMAGKSTFLRQVALIVFMAQTGSFVPADEAVIGTVDRIFTRVGASDNLARGESTFLVEMNETANILHNATNKSLVLLDEIGRGTSTFDGLSIAWAVSEYLHNQKDIRPKTLFATHYHELTELSLLFPRIKNYNIAVEEWENQVIFLRKIVPGGTDNSYGIHVAQMAGLPLPVIERAREILTNLEANELTPGRTPKLAKRHSGRSVDQNQLSLFPPGIPSKFEKKLKDIDIDNMTPVDALIKLNELKKMMEE